MLRLLKIEWLKVKRYRAFWIFTALYLISIAGIIYIGYNINQVAREKMPVADLILGSPYSFPRIWATVGYMSSWLLYFPGILFILMLTNEFTFKTHRQNIIDGWERHDFVNVKFVFAFLFSMMTTIFTALVALVIGLSNEGATFSPEGMHRVGYIFIQTFSYISFAMLLAIVFRRSGIAIAIFFLYGLIFEWLFSALINSTLSMSPAGYFLPLQVTDMLLPIPFTTELFYRSVPADWVFLVASFVYLILYYYLARRKFQSDDL